MESDIVDITQIQDEDLLRKMWHQTEDFGRKKQIRTHMYKLREARLKEFYTTGEVLKDVQRSNSSPGLREQNKKNSQKKLEQTHADSLIDHSFLSLKSKEIRDSESPTRDVSYRISSNQDDGNWTVFTNETSDDGKRYTTTKIDRSQGSEKIDGGVVNYSTLTEQKSSTYRDEDPKSSSRTVQKSHRTSGQEVSKFDNNTIVRTKTSSSHVSRQYKSSGAETNENLNEKFITNEKAGSGDVQVVTEHEVRPGSYYTITKRTITQKPETVVSEEYSTSSATSAYKQDFGKISVEISPTHDAFARSLRAITPEELKSRASSGTITEKSCQERKSQDRSEEIYEIRMDGTRIIRGTPRKEVVEVEVNTGTWTRKKSSPSRDDRFATITKSRSPSPPKTIQRSPSPQKSTVVTEEILITNLSDKKGKSRSPSPPKTSPTQTRSSSPSKTVPAQPRSSSPPKTTPSQPSPPKTITKETQDVTEKKRHSLTSSLTSTTVSRQAYIDSIRKSDDSGDKPRKLSTPDKKTSRETSPTKFSRYDDFIATERSEMIKQRGSRDSSPTSNASDIEYISTNRQVTDLDDPEPVSEPKEEKASKKKPLKEKPSFRRSETYKERIRKILGMPEPDEPKATQTNYDDLYAGKEPVVEPPILKKRISLLGPDNDDTPRLNKKQSNPEMISTNRKQVETKVTRKSSVQDMSTQKRASPVKEVKKKEPQESKIDVIEGIMTLEFEFPKEPPKKVSKFGTETKTTKQEVRTTKSDIQVEEVSRKSPEKEVIPRKPSQTETTKIEVDLVSSIPEKTIEVISATNLELQKLHQISKKSKKDISEACIAMLEHESIKEATPKKVPKKDTTGTIQIIERPIEVVEVVDISQAFDTKILETQKTLAEKISVTNVVETNSIQETTLKKNLEKRTSRTEIVPQESPEKLPEVPKETSRKSPEKVSQIPKVISLGSPEKFPQVPRETKSPEKTPKEASPKSTEKLPQAPKEPKIPEKQPQTLIETSFKIPEKLPEAPREVRRKSPEKLPQALKSPEKAPKEASPKRTLEKKTSKKEIVDEEPQKKKPETKKKSEMSTLEEFKTDMYAKTALRSPNIVAQVFEFLDAEMSLASETTTEDSRTETEIAEEIEDTKKVEIIVDDKRKEKSPDDIRKPIKKPGLPKVEKECPKKTVKSRVVVEKTVELTPKKPVSKPKVVVEKTVELRRRDTPEDVRKTGVAKPKMIVEKTIELKKPKSEAKRPRTLVEKEVQQINILITNETPQTTVLRVKKDDVSTVKSTVRTVCSKTRMQSPEKVKKPITKPAPKPAEPKTIIKRVEKIIQIDNKIKESPPKVVPKPVRKPNVAEPPKKHIVTKTISLSKIEKPEPKSPTKILKKTTKVEETVVQKEIPEIFIKIGSSEELNEEARITLDYVRSKSSRDSSPEKICPIPVSPSEEFGHPRYPDQISEPDDLPKRKKLSTAFEDEVAIEKITEVTDESLLTVTEKVNRFSHTETAVKTPAQKVSRPKFEVTEDLKEDECLLSVSEKVNKFLTTTDVPTIEPTVKTNELTNLRGKVSEKVSKFLVTERVETTKQEEERYKPEMVTELTDEIENHPTEEVRIPEVSEKKTISLKSSEAVRKAKAMFENPVKPDDILSRPSVWEGRRLAKKTEEGRNVKLTDLGVKKPKEEPKVNGEVTLKSTRLILNERKVQEDEVDAKTEVPGYMKPLTRQSPEREEVAGCRRHLFRQEEVNRTEVSKPTTIYRPRKSSPEKEEPKSEEVPYIRPVSKVKEVVKTETMTIYKPRHSSPEKEEPKPGKITKPATIYKLRQASPEKEEPDDVPGYMRQTETYRHKETRETTKPTTIYRPKHSPEPEEVKPGKTDPTKRTTSPERDVPGYMKPLQRQEESQKSHLKSETRSSPERKKSEPSEVDDDAPRAGKKFGVVLRRTDSGRNVIVNSTATTLTERRRSSTTSQTGQAIEDIQDLELLEQMMEKAVGYEQRRRIRAQIRIVRRLISEGPVVRKASKVKEEKKSEEVSERKVFRKVSSKVEDKENVSLKNILPEKKEGKGSDCVTSSYGIGPTDENGLPLFGLRALRKSKKDNVHVTGTVISSHVYSESGKEPVGQVSVTKYSSDPKELGLDGSEKHPGCVSVTTTQKFGTSGTPTLKEITEKKKSSSDLKKSQEESRKVARRGSVKALSQKFIENAVETSKNEKQTYPKAGLILRTSSFNDSDSTTVVKQCVQEIHESSHYSERRSSLNKRGSFESPASVSLVLKAQKATTKDTPRRYSGDISDEHKLRTLLEQCTDYEERRNIREKLRRVMAEQEGPGPYRPFFYGFQSPTNTFPPRACANQVTKISAEEDDKTSVQELVETSQKTFSDGPNRTVKVSTTTHVTSSVTKTVKPMSPFAKFRQLDKQNSLNTPPSSPRTPGGGGSRGPLFKFTDPALSQSASTVKERLLQWCQFKTKEYQNIKLDNFSTSWADGLAFCALIHHFYPDAFDYYALTPQQRRHNFTLAFKVADERAGIAPLLDVDDMVAMRRPDWKCVFTYVQSIYRRFKDED